MLTDSFLGAGKPTSADNYGKSDNKGIVFEQTPLICIKQVLRPSDGYTIYYILNLLIGYTKYCSICLQSFITMVEIVSEFDTNTFGHGNDFDAQQPAPYK